MTTAASRLLSETPTGADRYDRVLSAFDGINLTKDQLLVWAGQCLSPTAPRFREAGILWIDGAVDVDLFRRAVEVVVRGSDVLRTTIDIVGGWPRQTVWERRESHLQVLELSPASDPDAEWRRRVAGWVRDEEAVAERLFRLALASLSPTRAALYVEQHQLISDAWSFALLSQRLCEAYASIRDGHAPRTDRWPQFSEYVTFERALRASAAYRASRSYWRREIARASGALLAPDAGDSVVGHSIRRQTRSLPPSLSAALQRAATGRDLPPELVICAASLAALALVLHRERGCTRIAIGLPFANRSSRRFKATLGSFMHVCPVLVEVDPGDRLPALCRRLERQIATAARHQHSAPPNPAADPVYDVVLNVHKRIPLVREFSGAPVRVDWLTSGVADPALRLSVREFGETGGLTLDLDCREVLFDASSQDLLLGRVIDLLAESSALPRSTARPSLAASSSCASAEEVRREQTDQRAAARSVVALVREADALEGAAVCAGRRWSAAELRATADRVAGALVAHGAGQGSLVAILAERSFASWATILGVLEAGAAFVPLDPSWPLERLRSVLRRAPEALLLASTARLPLADACARGARRPVIAIESVTRADSPAGERGGARISPAAEDLAYVIFTSGSTGEPKGAMVEHRGLANHLLAKLDVLGLRRGDRVSQTASHSFDVSIWQFFAPLLVGATTVILEDDVARDPRRLLGAIREENLTVLATVPCLLGPLVAWAEHRGVEQRDVPALRWVVSTGEPLPPAICRRWLERFPGVPIVNAYGPTECSDDVAHHVVFEPPPTDVDRVPVGRPIRNAQLYVLDENRRPVASGAPGDLWVGGVAVGRGYLGDRDHTAHSFAADPFCRDPAARLYRTGDIARRLPDGAIDVLGRADRAVKLRGNFVDLAEVEARLLRDPRVAQAAVVVRARADGSEEMTAFVAAAPATCADHRDGAGVGAGEPAGQRSLSRALRRGLAATLPPYMVPHSLRVVEALPLASSGKVDRAALAAPGWSEAVDSAPGNPPSSRVERAVGAMWADLLGRPVGSSDDFLDVGGDSLVAIQIAGRIEAELGRRISAATVLEAGTVAELAALIEAEPRDDAGGASGAGLPQALLDMLDTRAPDAAQPRPEQATADGHRRG